VEAKELPTWEENNTKFKLIAGEFMGYKSPVAVHSDLYMIEMIVEEPQSFDFANKLFGESGLYIMQGEVKQGEFVFEEKHILITKDAHLCSFEVSKPSRIYLFGGTPLPEERFIYWNFVSSSKERINQAKEDWINHRFPSVINDDGYVPIPKN
jgi:hypothetical protein